MVTSKIGKKTPGKLANRALFSALLISLISSPLCYADQQDTADQKKSVNFELLKVIEYSKSMKVRGYQVANGVYMGQVKVAGKYGFGLVADRKTFAWGINNKGISIQKRF